jgi:hypothetical protein
MTMMYLSIVVVVYNRMLADHGYGEKTICRIEMMK